MSIKEFLRKWTYHFLQSIISIIQHVTWKQIYFARSNDGFENSARVCKIICRCKNYYEFSHEKDFIFIHKSFVNPNIVLEDNISLYHLNEHEAFFVDCGAINIFSSKRSSFMYEAQFQHATHIIIMPIPSAKKISKEITFPNIPMLHAANHGRCGSTLLFKLFESLPNALSISEPNSFTDLAEFSRTQTISHSKLKDLCEVAIKMVVKHAISRKSEILFFKCQSMVSFITDVICDVVPQMKQVYMYRNPVPFVRSYEKLGYMNNWPSPRVDSLKTWAGIGLHKTLDGFPLYEDSFYSDLSTFSKFSIIWILGSSSYKKLLNQGYPVKGFKYENLLSHPNEYMQVLFDYMGVTGVKNHDFSSTMRQDSQAGTPYTSRHISKEELDKALTKIDDILKKEVDQLCQDYDVPLFWEGVTLPNTL